MFDPLQNESLSNFVTELGKLLSIRISQYHRKFYGGNEYEFFNRFIVCPCDEESDGYIIGELYRLKQHFDANLGVVFTKIYLSNLYLTCDGKVQYCLTFEPDFIDTTGDIEFIDFTLLGDKISFLGQQIVEVLESFSEESWTKVVRVVQKELSFDSLKYF
jgi:hypothetical protein